MAAAHASTRIPKPTLHRWAKAAGVDLGDLARAQTANASAAVSARAAEAKMTTAVRLEQILAQQLEALHLLGGFEVAALSALRDNGDLGYEPSIGGPVTVPTDVETRDHLARARLATETVMKRDVVGAATRAIHDLALLAGDATERGDLRVTFGVPRSDPRAADAAAVVQDLLEGHDQGR